MYAMGMVEAPLDDDVDVLRRQLWLVTDAAYRKALAHVREEAGRAAEPGQRRSRARLVARDAADDAPAGRRAGCVGRRVDRARAHAVRRAGAARAHALRRVGHADAGHALQRQQRRLHDGGADPGGAGAAVGRDPGRGRHAAARQRDRARADGGRACRRRPISPPGPASWPPGSSRSARRRWGRPTPGRCWSRGRRPPSCSRRRWCRCS